MNLNGKIAFITGSLRGIGWATAKLFAKHGANVILNDLNDEELLKQRIEELKSAFSIDANGFLFDVGDYNAVKDCYSNIFKKYKRLDILVNNAGILDDSLIGMISTKSIEKTFNVNINGTIYNLQYASRLMSRNKSGSIINLSSIIGRFGNSGQVVYGASKAAVIGVTLSAAKELAPMNIRVNAVAPGFVETDMTKELPDSIFQERLDSLRIGRIAKPEDIANAILFFASDYSTYITGQVLGVDGCMII